MTKEFWTITEVLKVFQVTRDFISDLEREDIICPICKEDTSNRLLSVAEMEKLRIAKILVEDMGVNIEGVDIILQMRQRMIEMRKQFDAILEDLAGHIHENLEGNS